MKIQRVEERLSALGNVIAIIVRSKSSSEVKIIFLVPRFPFCLQVSLLVTLHLLPALGLVTVRASLTGEGKPVSEVRSRPNYSIGKC